ncbi:MAG: hypothetical protein WC071_12015 [Victivallaceae bacterium]
MTITGRKTFARYRNTFAVVIVLFIIGTTYYFYENSFVSNCDSSAGKYLREIKPALQREQDKKQTPDKGNNALSNNDPTAIKLKSYGNNNIFLLDFINAIKYKDVIIKEILPEVNHFSCSNSASDNFYEWLKASVGGAHGRHKTLQRDLFYTFLFFEISGAGGGELVDLNKEKMSPFMNSLLTKKLFGDIDIYSWFYRSSDCDWLIEKPKKLDIPEFVIDCYPCDIKRAGWDYKTLLKKSKKNLKIVVLRLDNKSQITKYPNLEQTQDNSLQENSSQESEKSELKSAVCNEILNIAEKSKVKNVSKLKTFDYYSNIEVLIKFKGNYDSIKSFLSNLCHSDYLFAVKLIGIKNPEYLSEIMDKSKRPILFTEAECVFLIEFPVIDNTGGKL